jgi:hypothetical protein
VTLVDQELSLRTPSGVTRCHVTATAGADGSFPVALVVDSSANPGVSAHRVFDLVVAATRQWLPPGVEEPVWIYRWDERALAAVVLHERRVTRDHVMQPSPDGWEEWPIPGRLTQVLMR